MPDSLGGLQPSRRDDAATRVLDERKRGGELATGESFARRSSAHGSRGRGASFAGVSGGSCVIGVPTPRFGAEQLDDTLSPSTGEESHVKRWSRESEGAAEAAAPFIHGRGSVARTGVPVCRISCCRSRWAAPGPEKRGTWSSSNRTTNPRGRGLANGDALYERARKRATVQRSRTRRAAEQRRVAVSHRAGKRAPRVTGRKRHRGRGGGHSSMEGISDRVVAVAVTGSGSEAVSAPPKVGAQAMAGTNE